MSGLVFSEIRKVAGQKIIWGVTAALLLLNIFFVYREMTAPVDGGDGYTRLEISGFYEGKEGLDSKGLLRLLDSGGDPDTDGDGSLEGYLYGQISAADSYDDYLEGIMEEQERLSHSSFFSDPDSFFSRNVDKTASVYEKLMGTEVRAGRSYDVETVTDCPVTTYFIYAAVLLSGLRIALAEREGGYLSLTFPMRKGRIHTAMAKLSASAIVLFFILSVFYLSNYCTGVYLFGSAGLDRLVQGLDGYLACPYGITAGQYLLLFFAGQYTGFLAIMMFLFFISMVIKNTVLSCACNVIVFMVEEMIYRNTDIHSVFSLARQVNFAAGVDMASFYQNYRTMNFFGYPVSALVCTWISAGVLAVLSAVLACRSWCAAGNAFSPVLLKKKTLPHLLRVRIHTNLFLHECSKLLGMNRGMAVLICAGVIQIFSCAGFTVNFTEVDYYYEQYTDIMEGEISREKSQYLEKIREEWQEKEELAEIYAQKAETGEVSDSYAAWMQKQASVDDSEKQAYDLVCGQYDYLTSQYARGKDVRYISLTGYRALLDNEEADVADAVKMMLAILFGLCTLFSCEKRSHMDQIISACENGRQRVRKRKITAALCYVCLSWALAFLPRIILVMEGYGLPHLAWSSAGLEWFSGMPARIPVWGAVLILQLVRISGGMVLALAVLWISARVENAAVTVILGMVLALLPVMTWYLGMTGEWGILSLATGNILIK